MSNSNFTLFINEFNTIYGFINHSLNFVLSINLLYVFSDTIFTHFKHHRGSHSGLDLIRFMKITTKPRSSDWVSDTNSDPRPRLRYQL